MKKTLKPFFALLCLVLLFGILSSCTESISTQKPVETAEETPVDGIPVSALPEYSVIYPETKDYSKLIPVVGELLDTIHSEFGIRLNARDDYVHAGTDYVISDYEILLGPTNREESLTVCRNVPKKNDYEIRVCGKKLVVAANNADALIVAIRALIGILNSAEKNSVFFSPAQALRFDGQYEVGKLYLGGAEISDYTLVYQKNDTCKGLAEQIASAAERGGYLLHTAADSTNMPAGKRIFLGKTMAPLPSDLTVATAEDRFYVGFYQGDLYLYGTTVSAVYHAVEPLLTAIEKASGESTDLALQNGSFPNVDTSLKTMSFNILCNQRTDERVAAVIDTIRRNDPDTFGVQEAAPAWMTILKDSFGAEYECVGEGRGGSSSEYSAIFYRKDRFNLIESGTQWLSETPTVKGSKMAGAEYPRIFTYAVLECKDTGRRFIHLNTHTDHVPDQTVDGAEVRLKQVQVITRFLKQNYFDLPTIISGDLNDQKSSPSVQHLLASGYDHCADIALSSDKTPTYSNRVIDYLLYSHNDFFLYEYRVDTTTYPNGLNGETASDHRAIIVRYEIRS